MLKPRFSAVLSAIKANQKLGFNTTNVLELL